MRYVFAPGRDVIVGHGGHCDVRLDPDGPGPDTQPVPDVVLRFAGTHWLAVDQSHRGLFLDGVRMSTIDIRDGQTIAIGDPQSGPRLRFQVTAPDDAPPPNTDPMGVKKPAPPLVQAPLESPAEPAPTSIPAPPAEDPPTTAIPAPPAEDPPTTAIPAPPAADYGPVEPSPLERPTRPFRVPSADAATAPAAVDDAPAKAPGLVERMTEAGRKMLPGRTDPELDELPPQTSRLPLLPGARTIGVAAYNLGCTVDGTEVLSNITFTAPPGSLIAVVGPSAARNFALTGLLGGTRPRSGGLLTVDGHDAHAEPDVLRLRIGVVSRDNRAQPRLTVERALGYAAELRLPPNTSPENRERVIAQVLDELELTPHRTTRVAKLPPEARRCVSLAVELLTRPSLLVVEGPGAGLDPVQEHHVMALLRRQADLGCVVVIAGTSPAYLNMCDQVLLLTPAGQLAFAGPPSHVDSALGSTDWFDIFGRISADPYGAHHAFLMRQQASVSSTPPSVARPQRLAPAPGFGRQLRMLARRQLRLLLASPVYSVLLSALPFALGALTLLIPGNSGLARPGPASANTHEAIEILAALNFAAVLMGTVLTIGSVVSERRIFRREQTIGLSASAYLLAKLIVFGLIAAVQAAILTAIVIVAKGGPRHGAALLGTSPLAAGIELYLSVAATAIVSAIVGLALSSLGKSMAEVVPLLIPALLASLLFAGGLVSLVGTWGYDQVSWFIPAQWGFAASAATVDLRRIDKLAADNAVWSHYSGWWVFDMLMLGVLAALWLGFVRYRLRPPTITPADREKQQSLPRSG
ncbi:MAG: ABC transporter ATP-binding protein [Mycobacterium sp.]|uniref:ABC transporter permease n=1 Tax=Mycobacterium sp. TaxID=1785 RepID=UPI000CA70858|nr:ABC transporter permease [Mycobacterium sp.]PJE04096.1 MAG: ABC transporter ATP-binding protein [Mycobacterium sp.]PJE04779.1 MAG: ABC transporter ATP-binding protein [Mycobacterium sp.]